MNFTPEQLVKAKASKSVDELLAYANEVGYKLSEDEAKQYFAKWHAVGALSDDELDNVSGGCGGDEEETPPEVTEYYYPEFVGAGVAASWKPICPNELHLISCNSCGGYLYTPGVMTQTCTGRHCRK